MEEEGTLMEDESFIDRLRSGDQEEEEEECYDLFSPPSNSLSCCYSPCSAAERILSFNGAGKEEAAYQRSSDSSVSSSSSSNHSKTTKKKVGSGSRCGRWKKSAVNGSIGGAVKKSKMEASTGHDSSAKIRDSLSNLVPGRKEKLGDRIMALQQLVSPFGKSDTSSVLHETLGYIRFLHDQVQVLSSPYLQRLPSSDHLLRGDGGRSSDLRSRGLCLVPVSCTEHVANVNGADLWTPAMRNDNSKH